MAETRTPALPGSGVELVSDVRPSPFSEDWYEINDARHFWFEWRLAAALRQVADLGISRQEPLRVLDVGCGRGVLRDQFEAATAWVVDITDVHLDAVSRAAAGRGRRLYYDVLERRPEFRGFYDIVLLFDVLEHVAEPQHFLAAVVEHVRPGGYLLLNVPALNSLMSAFDDAAGHLRRYDKRSLARDVSSAPCEVLGLHYWGLSLLPLLVLRKLLLRRPATAETIRRGLEPPGPLARALLRGLMKLETKLLLRAPLGSSLLLAARRRS